MKYQLFAHEVLGNDEDGYEVNDSFKIADDIDLPDDWTLEQLKAELDLNGVNYPPNFIIDPHNCYDQHVELEEACGKPMGFLRAV